METILQEIFSEKGIIYGLFLLSCLLLLFRGFPYMITKFFELQEKQHAAYKEELEQITSTFMTSVNASNAWHQSHSSKLDEIKVMVNDIVEDKKFQSRSRTR